MHRTTPHIKNDPTQFVNGAKDKKQQCVSSPPVTFPSSVNPPNSAPKPFPPQLLLHTPFFSSCLCPLLINHYQQQAHSDKVWVCGQKRGHVWRESPL